ncbi:MAG TPA: thioredoxin family protein [Steroidobacteraceae bacterium]|jgi:thioredoxin 1
MNSPDSTSLYSALQPKRTEIDALLQPVVVEFGTSWCGYCQAAQPLIAAAFARHPLVRHFRVEDGKGRALGRSFAVKLWPTLIFLREGKEVARVVRPADAGAISAALAKIDPL